MTNKVILEKAIQKAIDGGWRPVGRDHEHPDLIKDLSLEGVDKCYIYSHGFAKALWGEELVYTDGDFVQTPAWCHHLKVMVITPDPIKYLGENL